MSPDRMHVRGLRPTVCSAILCAMATGRHERVIEASALILAEPECLRDR
jgi:hypothetical protein